VLKPLAIRRKVHGDHRVSGSEESVYLYTNEEDGKTLRRYWTSAGQHFAGRAAIDIVGRNVDEILLARSGPLPWRSKSSGLVA
jgi:hypothetical protein